MRGPFAELGFPPHAVIAARRIAVELALVPFLALALAQPAGAAFTAVAPEPRPPSEHRSATLPERVALTEAAAPYGLAAGDSMSYAAAFTDYDGDGDADLYVNHHWKGPANFYRNDGLPPWVNTNSHLGTAHPDRHDCLWGDFNNDGSPDQYITKGGDQPKDLFWNRGGGILQEGGGPAGVQDVNGRGRELTLIDADNDGLLDIFAVNDFRAGFPKPSVLLHNLGNEVFERFPNIQSVFTATLHVAGADYDEDGDPDLITTNPPFAPGTFWRNDGNLTWTDITSSAFPGITEPLRQAQGLSWADYDNDGDLDLLGCGGNRAVWDYAGLESDSLRWYAECAPGQTKTVSIVTDGDSVQVWAASATYEATRMWYGAAGESTTVFPAKFALGDIAGVPPQVAAGKRGLFLGSLAVAAGDSVFLALSATQPAGLELLAGGSVRSSGAILSWAKPGYAPRPGFSLGNFTNRLYRNEGNGTFTEVTSPALDVSSPSVSSMGGAWGDYDNDGWIDVYVSTSGNVETGNVPNWLYHNDGDGTFTEVAAAEGVAGTTRGLTDGAAWGDVNGDGFLDLFVDNGAEHPPFGVGPRELFLNGGNRNHWIQVQLRGITSNGSGIGARLRLVTPDGVQWRWRLGESDNCFSDQTTLHAGLGDAMSVDSLQVLWPSGVVDTYTAVPADEQYWAIEGAALRLLGDPHLSAAPESVAASVVLNGSTTFTASLDNDGARASVFGVRCESCTGSSATWLTADPDTGGVWPGGGRTVSLHADMNGLPQGSYCGRAIFASNSSQGPDTVTVNVTVNGSVDSPPATDVPAAFFLAAPRPNPSRGSVGVVFGLPAEQVVDVGVWGVDGRRVATLASGLLSAGRHALTWDGRDTRGARVAAGVYLVRASSPSGRGVRKVTLLD